MPQAVSFRDALERLLGEDLFVRPAIAASQSQRGSSPKRSAGCIPGTFFGMRDGWNASYRSASAAKGEVVVRVSVPGNTRQE